MTNLEHMKTLDAEGVAKLIFPNMGYDADSCETFLAGRVEDCEDNCAACMTNWLNRERV